MKIDDFFTTATNRVCTKRNSFYNFPTINWEVVESLPEMQAMKGCPQHSGWHQEGDVWQHTKNCVDALERFAISHPYFTVSKELVLATLLHDIGKPLTTKKNQETHEWVAPYHGVAGARVVRRLLCDEEDILRRERVCALVRDHMLYHYCTDTDGKIIPSQIYKTNNSYASPIEFLILNYADDFGSTNDQTEEYRYNRLRQIEDYIEKNKLCSLKRFSNSVEKLTQTNGHDRIEPTQGDSSFRMTVFIGLPGAGKDTLFEKVYAPQGDKMISRDAVRKDLGIITSDEEKTNGSKEQEAEVSNIVEAQIRTCCRNRQSFVLNNTNLQQVFRKEMIWSILEDPTLPKPFIEMVVFETPLDVCQERRRDMIRPEVITKMSKRLDYPMPYEANRIYAVKDGEMQLLWDDHYSEPSRHYNCTDGLFRKHRWWNAITDWVRLQLSRI